MGQNSVSKKCDVNYHPFVVFLRVHSFCICLFLFLKDAKTNKRTQAHYLQFLPLHVF